MGKSIFFLRHEMLSVLIIIGLIFGTLSPVAAADYYKGQVITMLVSTSAGGGGDIWARLINNRLNDRKLLLGINPPELNIVPRNPSAMRFRDLRSTAERTEWSSKR